MQSGTVAINDLTITNAKAQGGNGGTQGMAVKNFGGGGGGGGAGLGGALFVASGANVTVSNVNLRANLARGGNGGADVTIPATQRLARVAVAAAIGRPEPTAVTAASSSAVEAVPAVAGTVPIEDGKPVASAVVAAAAAMTAGHRRFWRRRRWRRRYGNGGMVCPVASEAAMAAAAAAPAAAAAAAPDSAVRSSSSRAAA